MFLNKALNAEWKPPSQTNDPAIPGANESVTGYDMGFGVFYRAERVYLGISTTQLIQSELNYERANYRLRRNYYATAGAVFPLGNPSWEFSPSVLVYSDGTTTQFSANANLIYNGKVWGGVGYRINSVIAMIGFDLFNGVKIGYAFDYTHTSMRGHFTAGGSHELMINYCFNIIKERVVRGYRSVRFL
jgi:type IX secretion system PorP/SprF family membrane protein